MKTEIYICRVLDPAKPMTLSEFNTGQRRYFKGDSDGIVNCFRTDLIWSGYRSLLIACEQHDLASRSRSYEERLNFLLTVWADVTRVEVCPCAEGFIRSSGVLSELEENVGASEDLERYHFCRIQKFSIAPQCCWNHSREGSTKRSLI